MTVTALGGISLIAIGHANRHGIPDLVGFGSTLIDATNEACFMAGYVAWADGASHTVNTTGSSSLGWMSGAVTFANAGTTVKVGLAAVDTANGPPVRPVNVANVVTFSVSASFAGAGGGITASAWQTSVPTAGTMTIANGDLVVFAVQATAIAGVDLVNVNAVTNAQSASIPGVSEFTGAAFSSSGRIPNMVITASDGTLGFIAGSYVASVPATTQTYNNTSSPKEYGNFFQLPVPVNIYGILCNGKFVGDGNVVLYSDPLGTPVAQKTVAVDLNTVLASGGSYGAFYFPSPYSLAANAPCAAILQPSSATNVSAIYKSFNSSAHQGADALGTNCYAINRTTGAFAAQNSNKDRFGIGLLVGAFDAGGTSGVSPAPIIIARGTPY